MTRPHVIKITDDRLLQAVLTLALLSSIGIPLGQALGVWDPEASWYVPVLVLALIAIVRAVAVVPEIHTNVSYLREVADVKVQRLANVADFYGNLTGAVRRAESSLDLTHIRDSPPSDFGAGAGTFFDDLVTWCSKDGRSIRRIISVKSAAMFLWAQELAAETRAMPQFQVRVIAWTLPAPAMNMAIIDGKVTYLALTGDTLERTSGLGIEDAEAAQYFTSYYNNLWHSARPLDDWLEENDSAEGFAPTRRR